MTYLYPTASTVAIFLNGYHIEQGYQLQYKESVNKVPIFGYNDHTYSKIALGRQMVQGVLVVNFLFAGYLNAIIDTLYNDNGAYVPKLYNYGFSEKGESQKQRLITDIKNELRTELPPNEDAETRSARASYIASLLSKDKATKDATKKALESFISSQGQDEPSIIRDLGSPLTINNQNITLDIYYQDPEYCTWFTRFKNVNFYEVSQVTSMAGAEGSSDPLYEVYSFVASEKIIKLVGEIE
tara:strand:+ start:74187 stop:74909 length:723 start_codon:yes stop_codon:yes gene_type:complete